MKKIRALTAAAAVAITIATAGTAHAISELKDKEVSCDGVTIQTVGTIYPLVTKSASITQRAATTESSTSIVWFRNAAGNETSKGRVSNGMTVSWPTLNQGTWSVRALRSEAKNCNGALPGHGNYHLYLTVSHSV